MATITVLGGTGYTGAAIVAEAARRGHEVTSLSRNRPVEPVAGVTYVSGSVTAGDPASLVAGSDAVVASLSPRGELAGKVADIYQAVAETAEESGTRLVVIGGWNSLRRSPGAPRIAFSEHVPPQFADEARELAGFADWLDGTPEELDWLFVSPAQGYGAHSPGEAQGTYRIGSDVAFTDTEGRSELSAPDLAMAIVDLIERDEHHREHLSVAY
jgi:putative NADH-flavin reductase